MQAGVKIIKGESKNEEIIKIINNKFIGVYNPFYVYGDRLHTSRKSNR